MSPQTRIETECRRFMATRRSLHLATVDADGRPHASYAPFVIDGDAFHVFVSELSQHTGNLQASRHASVLLIEDEAEATNPFARVRLVLDCTAESIARDSTLWIEVIDLFEHRFGELVATLKKLQDFVLFRLPPRGAVYVKGFGQAYRLEGDGLERITHIAPRSQ